MNTKRSIFLATVLTIAAIGQIILTIVLYNQEGSSSWRNIGWVLLWISGIFGLLPIFTFSRKGGVPKGKAYVHTTQLVDSGIYSIVRHPQYLSGVLMSAALPLIAQNWITVIPGIIAAGCDYASTVDEENSCIEKFGEAYKDYMEKVPRMNVLAGIVRWLRRRSEGITNEQKNV